MINEALAVNEKTTSVVSETSSLDPNTLWQSLAAALKSRVNEYVFQTWFAPLHPTCIRDHQLIIQTHDRFTKDWIDDHYRDVVLEALNETGLGLKHEIDEFELEVNDALRPHDAPGTHQVTVSAQSAQKKQLNDKYLFSNFVVGPSNQFAFAASRAVADRPAQAYNPLFLFGGVGLGKTHLINAVGHGVLANFQNYRIIYMSSEQFMNEVINGIRYGKMEEFHNKYRKNCDMLLMDDIQLIAGKDRTQEEFFHTFNALYESKKQIIVTSDKLPHEISGLEERMRTRFQWGLIADIQPPEIETRVAILKKKAELEGAELPDGVAMFLAENIRSNVRELEGALIRVIAHSSLTGQRISIDYAREVLAEILANRQNLVTVEGIQKIVAAYYSVRVADLKSPRRHKVVAKPRQVAMYLCRKLLNTSYPELGERFGGKDHTTILSACRKMELLEQKDNALRSEVQELKRRIQE